MASSVIGALRVSLGLDSAEFERGVNRTQAPLRNLSSNMRTVTSGSGALGRGVQNASYQIGDFAVQVAAGTSASRAMAMQLPQLLGGFGILGAVLGAVAAIAGALVPVFFKTDDSAGKLSETLGDLTKSVSAYKSAADAASRPMAALSESFAGNEAAASRMLAIQREIAEMQAQRAFGASSRGLAGAFGADFSGYSAENLRSLGDSLGQMREQQEALNLAIESFGQVSDAAGAAAFERLEAQRLAMGEFFRATTNYRNELGNLAATFNISEQAAAQLAVAMRAAQEATGIENQVDAARELAATIYEVTGGLKNADDATLALYSQLLEAVAAGLQIESIDFASGIGAGADAAATLARNLGVSLDVARTIAGMGAAEDMLAAGDGRGSQRETRRNAIEANTTRILRQQAGLRASFIATQDAANGLTDALTGGGGGRSMPKALVEVDAAAQNLQSTFDTVKSSMSEAFMSMVDGTKSAKDAFREMALAIIKQLYDVLVVQQLVGSFNATTGAGSGIVGFLGRVFTGGLAGNANGTNNFAGGLTRINERGGEIVNLPRGSQIIPNDISKRMASGDGGAVTVHQTINVTTGVQATVRAELMQLMPRIAEASKAAVVDARKRGGGFAAAFS